jgi:hypothetical protein
LLILAQPMVLRCALACGSLVELRAISFRHA